MISAPIPQEIISLILEQYLFDDTSTLQTCALVAHSFLISSQKGLFHTIRLDRDEAQQRCQKLHQVLLANPNLLGHVRELLVLDYDSDPSLSSYPTRHWASREETLHAIMKMLPDLQLLSFTFNDHRSPSDWKRLSVELKIALGRVFALPSLAVCKLKGIYNLPAEYFRASEHLKELSLTDVSVARDQLGMISAYCGAMKIQSLEILTLEDIDDDDTLFEAMRASIDMSHLRKVSVCSMSPNVVWEATKDSVHSLDTLTWDFDEMHFNAGNMDLPAFEALRVLHLAADLMPGIGMITWLVRSLETMSRVGDVKNLKEIVIYLNYEMAEDDLVYVLAKSHRLWSDFDTVLAASGKFANMDKLFIYVCSVDEVDIVQELLHVSLPRLSTNGILGIHATAMNSDELRILHPEQVPWRRR